MWLVDMLLACLRGGTMIDRVLSTHGAVYEGQFSPERDRIVGHVAHWRHVSDKHPQAVIALRDGEIVGSTSEFIGPGKTWRFIIPVTVTVADIMRGRLQVFAVDNLGTRSALPINGEAQTRIVREAKEGIHS